MTLGRFTGLNPGIVPSKSAQRRRERLPPGGRGRPGLAGAAGASPGPAGWLRRRQAGVPGGPGVPCRLRAGLAQGPRPGIGWGSAGVCPRPLLAPRAEKGPPARRPTPPPQCLGPKVAARSERNARGPGAESGNLLLGARRAVWQSPLQPRGAGDSRGRAARGAGGGEQREGRCAERERTGRGGAGSPGARRPAVANPLAHRAPGRRAPGRAEAHALRAL